MGAPVRIGKLFITPASEIALKKSGQCLQDFLRRHERGDRGDGLSAAEDRLNRIAEQAGEPLLSAYTLRCGLVLWIHTNVRLCYTSVELLGEED
jgi:hypothetical protein